LKRLHEPIVRGDEFAAFALGQGDVEAIVNTNPELRRDGERAGQQVG